MPLDLSKKDQQAIFRRKWGIYQRQRPFRRKIDNNRHSQLFTCTEEQTKEIIFRTYYDHCHVLARKKTLHYGCLTGCQPGSQVEHNLESHNRFFIAFVMTDACRKEEIHNNSLIFSTVPRNSR